MQNNPLLHRFRRVNHIEAKRKDLEFIENIPNFLDTGNLGREEIVSLDWYRDNAKDYDDFLKKYGETKLVEGISFYQVEHIDEAIALIME